VRRIAPAFDGYATFEVNSLAAELFIDGLTLGAMKEELENMDRLQIKKDKIVDSKGNSVRLRGPNIGGFMMMENFINGFVGSESGQRDALVEALGPTKAQFFFSRWLDHIFAEEDVRFIKDLGATVIRLPMNYRHFENDEEPFVYLEAGFERLNRVVDWCAQYGLYVVLELHAVQGWQNTDWHSDNDSRHTYFWTHKQFQARFLALWQEIARRYKDNQTVAGYGLMNEPVTNAPRGRFDSHYRPNFDIMNRIYRQGVSAIRAFDPDHIIFLEGDLFSVLFSALEPPFAENLAYSSHNYNISTLGSGFYPGMINDERWNRARQLRAYREMEGTKYSEEYQVPLWISEFGSVFNGPAEEFGSRLLAMEDQIDIFETHGAHWSNWTYKDVGIMGMVYVHPESEYMEMIRSVYQMKIELHTDHWMGYARETNATRTVNQLADIVEEVVGNTDVDSVSNHRYLIQHTLTNYVATMLQPLYASLFKGMSDERIDSVLSSFALKNCLPRKELLAMLTKYMAR